MKPKPKRRRPRAGTVAEKAQFGIVVALIVALAGLLCYASARHYVRMDWRSSAQQPLTDDTRALLSRVNQHVQASIIHPTLSFPQDSELMHTRDMVKQVLAQFHAVNPRIAVEEVDPNTPEGRARLQKLVRQTGETKLPLVCVLFTTAGGHRVVSFDELAVRASGALTGPRAFLGEATFARAIAMLTGLGALAPDPTSGARKLQSLDLPPARITAARYIFIGALPACFVVLGVVVWLVRRR